MNKTGWIPPDDRSPEQKKLNAEFLEEAGTFALVGSLVDDVPDRVIFAELQKAHLGKLIPRINQLSGSCVGAGGAQAYANAMLGDRVHRGDREEVKLPYPWATYGVGRAIAGMRTPGEGSFGAAQAKACSPSNFGYLPFDHPGLPQPRVSRNWVRWSSAIEIKWSHPGSWPTPRSELEPIAKTFGIHTVTQIKSTESWQSMLAQGYGVTLASMFGTKPTVRGDVLIGEWNDQWAHQMSSSGYLKHSQHGLLFLIDNQWGEASHPKCPTLSEIGVDGSFWITEATAKKILKDRNSEVFGHSATGGFPSQEIDWTHGSFED